MLYDVNGRTALVHYHSWTDDWHSIDWKECYNSRALELESQISANLDIADIKFYISEESAFFPYDETTESVLIRLAMLLRQRGGIITIYWGTDIHEGHRHLLSAGIALNYDPWLPLYVSTIVWRDSETAPQTPRCLFNCLNSKPWIHRCVMMDQLAKHNLISDNLVTWRTDAAYWPGEIEYVWQHWIPEILKLEEIATSWSRQWTMPHIYHTSLLDLVTETDVTLPFITEKTWRPIMFNRPFISLAWPGYHMWLKSHGFELYDELFDYEFDTLPNAQDRANSIAEQLSRLMSTDIHALQHAVANKTQKNKQIALSKAGRLVVPSIVKDFYERKLRWWHDKSASN